MLKMWLLVGASVLSVGIARPQNLSTTTDSDIQSLKQRAEKGDDAAQNELGRAYQLGISVQQDYPAALRWYKQAAEHGNTDAKFSLAGLYFDGLGVAKNYAEAARWYGCGQPSTAALSSCKAIKYTDLPTGAKTLLKKLHCTVAAGDSYDYGSAVDLNEDGVPEYQFCCEPASHGPCSAVLIAQVGSGWKDLTPKNGILGYSGACTLMVVLASKTQGFHDICLPNQCAPASAKACVPTVLKFASHYEASANDSGAHSTEKPAFK